jgi:hypothetical protein
VRRRRFSLPSAAGERHSELRFFQMSTPFQYV